MREKNIISVIPILSVIPKRAQRARDLGKATPIVLFIFLLAFTFPLKTFAQEAPLFNSNPLAAVEDQGRDFAACASGWRQFLSSAIGYEDFIDYVADFFRWPAHYADVIALQEQVNKARYAVMAAYMRCDLDRLNSVTNAYYKLEAELYFVRHFVDTSGNYARVLTKDSTTREQLKREFVRAMEKFFILRDQGDGSGNYKAVLEGYFDLFVAKYQDRGERYSNFEGDPVFDQLDEKFQKLVDTLKSFSELGDQFVGVAKDTADIAIDAASSVKDATVSLVDSPGKALSQAVNSIDNMFTVCPASGNPDDCVSLTDALLQASGVGVNALITTGNVLYDVAVGGAQTVAGVSKESFDALVDLLSNTPQTRVTYNEVIEALKKVEELQAEGNFQGTLRARYELLYGTVSGPGLTETIATIDRTLATLRNRSQKSLDSLEQCAAYVVKRVCK